MSAGRAGSSGLPSCFSWLYRYSRGIPVCGTNVTVLKSPDDFYQTLLNQISGAKRRIKISSLYLGTGELEGNLVDCLSSSLRNKPDLKCDVLLDNLRGTRGCPNSVTMLKDVLKYTKQMQLHLYHTPLLRGVAKRLLPQRFNEVAGLQHTKIHLFDNNVLLTGANLSHDYFTKRRDRYILFMDSIALSNYVSELHKMICDHSLTLDTASTSVGSTTTHPLADTLAHKQSMEESVNRLIGGHTYDTCKTREKTGSHFIGTYTKETSSQSDQTHSSTEETSSHSDTDKAHSCTEEAGSDTHIFPLVQMGPYDIRQDETVTSQILSMPGEEDQMFLASGYFNLPPLYSSAIIKSKGACSVLAASPQANGFYGAMGVAKYVPYMYIHFAELFLQMIRNHNLDHRIKYFEYEEQDWTFHSKGLWYYRGGHSHPCLSVIGSSNFGYRSLARDIEFQVAIVTENETLQEMLHCEKNNLFDKGKVIGLETVSSDKSRKLNSLVLLATKFLQKFV